MWGRGGAINYRGSKVAASQLEEAILLIPEFRGKIQNFAFNSFQKEDSNRLEIWLKFKSENDFEEYDHNIDSLTVTLLKNLTNINQDFKFQLINAPESAYPTVKLFPFGQSPMSNQDPQRKKKYVFNESETMQKNRYKCKLEPYQR